MLFSKTLGKCFQKKPELIFLTLKCDVYFLLKLNLYDLLFIP